MDYIILKHKCTFIWRPNHFNTQFCVIFQYYKGDNFITVASCDYIKLCMIILAVCQGITFLKFPLHEKVALI